MKKKFSKILGVGLALALVLSLVVMGAPVSAAAMTPVTAAPLNDMAGATTTYTIGFTTVTPYVIDSVEMEFDTGFNVDSAALSGTATGIGAGTVTSSGLVVTYSLTESELLDEAAITIALIGIVNPATGTYSVTVRTISGTTTIDEGTDADVPIVPAPVSFEVVPETVTAGDPFFVTITAKDVSEVTVEGYNGDHLIYFSSTASDPKTIPAFAVINFDEGSGGVGISLEEFVLNVVEAEKTITVTDNEINVTGTSDEITVEVAALGYLTITGTPSTVTAGEAFVSDIIVTAIDAEGNAMILEDSAVTWRSTDPEANAGAEADSGLPEASQTLTAGTITFDGADFTLKTAGPQTITVTEDGDGISGDAFITVDPAVATKLTVAGDPATIGADGSATSTITAEAWDASWDTDGNLDTNYSASVTFATSLGTLSGESTAFDAGVATATLTSTEVGEATILVTSGTLTDVTTTVTLGPALLAEVWVAIDGSDTNLGTETSPVKTISDAITKVAAGGTIKVGPGTYTLSTAGITIIEDKVGLTVESTDGAASTIIDASAATGGAGIYITSDDVTFEDFTVQGNGSGGNVDGVWIKYSTEGVTVKNNVFTDTKIGVVLTYDHSNWPTYVVVGATVSGNVIEDSYAGILLQGAAKDSTISDNTITDCSEGRGISFMGGTEADPTQGNTIYGNTITGSEDRGIFVKRGEGAELQKFFNNNVIEGNTVSGGEFRGIEIAADLTVTYLVITRNNVTDNIGGGILIGSWDFAEDSVINFNNITGNTDYGIVATVDPGAEVIDATQNWWGSVVGSEIHSMISELTAGDVDYGSWLNAPHAIPAITLHTGWNLISLPLLPTDPSIATVLADVDVTIIKVAYYTPEGSYLNYIPLEPGASELTTMDHGKGYWIDVTGSGMLSVTGVELALPGVVPPSYDLVVGWNLIGFTSTSTATVLEYLGPAVTNMLEAMYGYNAVTGLYQNIVSATPLVPGNGYWLAVTDVGTIFP